jgi:pentatricopeptide repeat protein
LQSLERRLQLSPAHVWTDVGPLLRALSLASEHRDARQSGRAGSRAASTDIAAVFAHYRGPFLPDDEDLPWIIAGREAIKTAVRSALLTADLLLAGRDDVPLVGALELAFAADPTSEDLARALMRALLRGGQLGEALRVYRRLRDMLSIVLGVKPTRETEQLRESIHAAAPAGSVASDAAFP